MGAGTNYYPPPLQTVILGLEPGQVTQPIEIENGIAPSPDARRARTRLHSRLHTRRARLSILRIPGGRTAPALDAAATLAQTIDTCNDLYEWMRTTGTPQDRLFPRPRGPRDIPQSVALELAKLDANEKSWNLTDEGGNLLFLMLCQREGALPDGATRDDVLRQLQAQKLQGYAEALLADLRAQATIRSSANDRPSHRHQLRRTRRYRS